LSFAPTVAFLFLPGSDFLLPGAPQSQKSIEQQLKEKYDPSRVEANRVALQAGSVLVAQQGNIKANPASRQLYSPKPYKKDGRVKRSVRNGYGPVEASTTRHQKL
jgi:hypothetical protein